MNVTDFFRRFVKEMGYEEGSRVTGLRVEFNNGVTINPSLYLGNDAFEYHFDSSKHTFTWSFDEGEELFVNEISFPKRALVASAFKPAPNVVTIGLLHERHNED